MCKTPNISLLYKNKVTEPFYTTIGLKQGDILSRKFFNLFINNLPSFSVDTSNGNIEKPKLENTNIRSSFSNFFTSTKENHRTKLTF